MRALLVVVLVSACAARQPTTTRVYICADGVFEAEAGALLVDGRRAERVGGDSTAMRYRLATTNRELVYVLPSDPRQDALVWDLRRAPSNARPVACMARGGHTDLLTRWLSGQSLDEIARELGLAGRRDARVRMIAALRWARTMLSAEPRLPASLAGIVCGKHCGPPSRRPPPGR